MRSNILMVLGLIILFSLLTWSLFQLLAEKNLLAEIKIHSEEINLEKNQLKKQNELLTSKVKELNSIIKKIVKEPSQNKEKIKLNEKKKISISSSNREPILSSLVKTLLCDNSAECKYTYTLATLIGRAIVQAEAIVGPRDKDYVLLGYEFTNNPAPQIWFPGNRKHVVIQLTQKAMLNKKKALYQMGHEAFHTLSPIVGDANALEEGLATEFSINFVNNLNIEIDQDYISSVNYSSAYNLIGCLRNYEPKLNQHLKQMRLDGYQIGLANQHVLSKYFLNTPEYILRILAKKLPDFYVQDIKMSKSCSVQ